jgi:predicted nucleic acid-binding protein
LPGRVVVDTSGFFAPAARLKALIESGAVLSTADLALFEFVKAVRREASKARGAGKLRRAEAMEGLERRFPGFLRALEIEIWTSRFSHDDLDEVYRRVAAGHEPGDSMIWVKMKNLGLDTIATSDASDWKAIGAKVVPMA